MNANAKKWVAALRSGEFSQTQGHLRDYKGYCCLGVACELYRRETGKGVWDEHLGEHQRYLRFNLTEDGREVAYGTALPAPVRDWLGLNGKSGGYDDGYLGTSLSNQNDNRVSFTKIADIIEHRPKGLFVRED